MAQDVNHRLRRDKSRKFSKRLQMVYWRDRRESSKDKNQGCQKNFQVVGIV